MNQIKNKKEEYDKILNKWKKNYESEYSEKGNLMEIEGFLEEYGEDDALNYYELKGYKQALKDVRELIEDVLKKKFTTNEGAHVVAEYRLKEILEELK